MIEVKYDIGQEVWTVVDNKLAQGKVQSVNVTANKPIGHVYTIARMGNYYNRRTCDVYENVVDYCYETLNNNGYKDLRIVKKDEVKK